MGGKEWEREGDGKMAQQVIVTRGLPASGKSTWAKTQLAEHPGQFKRINKDDLRAMLDGGKWSKGNEKFVLAVRDRLILEALSAGYAVIVDDTNLHPRHETRIRELVKGLATVEIQDFTDVPLETCLERDRQRPNYVGEQIIHSMYRQFLAPTPTPPAYDHSLPDAIICDLDGTLALLNGRNPYDATTCEQDSVNEPVADIVREFAQCGYAVLLTSGRSAAYRARTLSWLAYHSFRQPHGDFQLFMRADGDMRKDAVIKRELYEAHIVGKYNVHFVLDDRDQVVELWRSLGLTCLQVNYGDF